MVHAEALIGLEQHHDVESISSTPSSTPAAHCCGVQLKALGPTVGVNTPPATEGTPSPPRSASTSRKTTRGHGVGIAVIDSGLEESDDICSGKAGDFFDFTNSGRRAKPSDAFGHGTHVATLIAGEGKGSKVQVVWFAGQAADLRRPALCRRGTEGADRQPEGAR